MAANLGKRSRQRSKSYFGKKKQKVGGLEQLSIGMQGVLITTGDQEKLCVSEAYSLLNEYGDKLYGPEDLTLDKGGINSDDDDDDDGGDDDGGRGSDGDIEAAVAKEIERLKGKGKGSRPRRFQAVNTGAKHVVFIRCLEEIDPCRLVHHILSDIASSGVKKSRFCQRMLPVTKVCRATVSDLQKHVPSVLEPHFHTDSLIVHKFAVSYKARNNHDVNRDEIIRSVAAMVTRNGDFDHQVDLNKPNLTIVVEIIKNLCCLSVIKDFTKLKKYNLQSLAAPQDLDHTNNTSVGGSGDVCDASKQKLTVTDHAVKDGETESGDTSQSVIVGGRRNASTHLELSPKTGETVVFESGEDNKH